jgi:hypothetical protein
MSEPFKLYRLQQIDSQLDRDRARIVEIEKFLADEETVKHAQRESEQSTEQLNVVRKEVRQAEDLVRQQRLKIEQTESSLYGGKIHNPKELQDLQNETVALKRYLEILEDRLLTAMLQEEDTLKQDSVTQKNLAVTIQDLNNRCSDLKNERSGLLQQITNLDGERLAMVNNIPQEDLALYEQLRIQRRGLAVSKVSNKACSACGTTLNAALLHAVHLPNQISRCDACGRILYL